MDYIYYFFLLFLVLKLELYVEDEVLRTVGSFLGLMFNCINKLMEYLWVHSSVLAQLMHFYVSIDNSGV